MRIEINLDPTLFRELKAVSSEHKLTPQGYAAECVESILATRRLPRVAPAAHGARTVETTMRSRAEAECRDAGPMAAGEIPTTDELNCLADIT